MASIFGGNTGLTYEQIQQRRKLAEALRSAPGPRNAAEGWQALARGLVAGGTARHADREQKRLDEEWRQKVAGFGLDPTRAEIVANLPWQARDSYMLSYLDRKDAAAKAGAGKAAKEAMMADAIAAIAGVRAPEQRAGVALGPTNQAAAAGATSGQDLSLLQTQPGKMDSNELISLLLDPNVRGAGMADVAQAIYGIDNPPKPELPNEVQLYEYGQANPGFNDWRLDARRAGAPNVTQTIGPDMPRYWEKRSEEAANQMAEIESAENTARSALQGLGIMKQLMDSPDFYSGAGGEAVLAFRRAANAMGFDVGDTDAMEAFNAQSKAAALDVMGGSLGTGFSNADRDFVVDQVPNITTSPEGNRLIVAIQEKLQGRMMEIAQLAREYERNNKEYGLIGFGDFLAEWAEKHPLFDDNFVTKFTDKPKAPPTIPPMPLGMGLTPDQWRELWGTMTPEEQAEWVN